MEDEVKLSSKNLPPKQMEGYLAVKKKVSCPIPSRKYYCVLFGDVLQLFDNKRSYEQKQQNPKEQIDLQKVCCISETVQVIKGQKTNGDFCFKLELPDQYEVVFATKSKDEVKDWVECLKHTKSFYENCLQKQSVKNPLTNNENKDVNVDLSDNKNDTKSQAIAPNCLSLSIIMSHGPKYTAYMTPDGNLDDVWTAVLRGLPGHYCEKCQSCQLRRSTMELWAVDEEGFAFKVDESCTAYTKRDIYLLEHNYKLLVVFFEDSSFLVSPVDISIKSREVPEIELFARKLTSIDCSNAQLYLVTSSQSVTPFSPDEQPLTGYFWEQRGSEWSHRDRRGDKLLLKSRALVIPLDSRITAEKCQELKAKKLFEERRQKMAIQQIEKNQVQKRAIRTAVKAVDTVNTLHVDWSKTTIDKRKSKVTKPCVINAPKCSQSTVPFDYNSDDDILDDSKSEVLSQGGGGTNEGVVKRRTISESQAPLRRGAVRRKYGRRRTVPEINPVDKCLTFLPDCQSNQNDCGIAEQNERPHENTNSDVSDDNFMTEERPEANLTNEKNNEKHEQSRTDNIEQQGKELVSSSLRNNCISDDTTSKVPASGMTLSSPSLSTSSLPMNNTENLSTSQTLSITGNALKTLGIKDATSKQGCSPSQIGISVQVDDHDVDSKKITEEKDLSSELFQEQDENIINSTSNKSEGKNSSQVSDSTQEQNVDHCSVYVSNLVDSNIHIKTLRHSCDYYIVQSPLVLKTILDQYERINKGEEEVNSVCPTQKLCLSTIHLVYSNHHWVIENEENLSNDIEDENSEDENSEIFLLQSNIKVVFYPSTRMWSVRLVQRNEADAHSRDGESSNLTNKNNESNNIDVLLLSKKSEFPQLAMLDNSIRKIFYQAALVEGLDDTNYPDLRRVICIDFCSALHSLLIHGLKRRRTLFGTAKYSLWEVIETCTIAPEHITLIQKIKRLGQLEDKTCLELFVCECLNTGSDALAGWFESFQKQDLSLFYDDNALMRTLDGNILVQKLSRLTFLPFRLTYFDEIEKHLKERRQLAFVFE